MTKRQNDSESGGRIDQGRSDGAGFTDLFSSFISFANASTMFTIQQMQNCLVAMTDSRRSLDRFKESMDNLSDAMTNSMDDKIKSATDRMNKGTEQVMDAITPDSGNGHVELGEEVLTGRKS